MCYFYLACDAIFRNSVRNDFLQPFDSVRGGSESPVLLMRSLMTNQFPFLPSKIFFLSLGFWTFLLDMTICKFSPTPKISWYLKDSVKFNPFYFFQSTNISISVIIIIIASSSFLNRIWAHFFPRTSTGCIFDFVDRTSISLDLSPSLSISCVYFGVPSSALSSMSEGSRPRPFRFFRSPIDF